MKESLKAIVRKCNPYQTFTPISTRYRVVLPMDEIVLNHEIECYIMWVDSEPVLGIRDRGIRYYVCKYINCSQTAENLWNTIIEFRVNVFTGFPNIKSADRKSAPFKILQETWNQLGIHTNITPTELHNYLSICERYHHIVRRVFNRIRTYYPKMNKRIRLSIATNTVKKTAGLEGITWTLLLSGAIPKIVLTNLESFQGGQRARFKAM